MEKSSKFVAKAGIIAALYVVLTLLSNAFGLASGEIQVRISEALCILPCFTTAAIPGLAIGCLLSNTITGCAPLDIVFGTIATLIGALGTRCARKNRFLACIPPIVSNMIIVPFVLAKAYGVETAIPLMMLTVGAGEVISCGILGELLYTVIIKQNSLRSLIES